MADSDRDDAETTKVTKSGAAARRRSPFGELGDPPERGPAAYLAELIGTFGLVFFVCMVVVLYAPAPQEAAQPGLPAVQPFQDWAVIGLTHAFILFVLIQALAVVSGAHFNPAVTAAMAAIRQIRPVDAAIYVVVQLIGGLAGALVCKLLLDNATGESKQWGAVEVGTVVDGSTSVAFAAELIGTFFLVFAIVGVAVNPRGLKDWAGFAIGAILGAAVMILGPISGAGFNPARAFGPAVVGEFAEGAGSWILIWVLAPVLGALLAAFVYFQMFILPGRKGEEGMEPVG
jgi:glycerol uptake facilitator protein